MTTSSSARFGVVGHPIAHSQSPMIHEAFARQTGILLQYERILAPLDGFKKTIQDFFVQGGRGLNVTVPFKEQAYALAKDNLSVRASVAGAVNTLWMHDDALHGCNTDGAGLVADLQRLSHPVTDQRILLLGAGGAARGAAASLLEAGCAQLHIANRTPQKARQLRDDLTERLPGSHLRLSTSGLTQVGESATQQPPWDIVVNATSSSLNSEQALDVVINYGQNALAYDMVYGSQPTPFMQQARGQGAAHVADGLGMLVGQAAVSFALWHGIEPAIEPVLNDLRQRLAA